MGGGSTEQGPNLTSPRSERYALLALIMVMIPFALYVSSPKGTLNVGSNAPPTRSVGLADLVLTYNATGSAIVECEPGLTAFFFRSPTIRLTVVPIGQEGGLIKLNFSLEIRGDATLGTRDEIERTRALNESLEITKDFLYSRNIVVDYDKETRKAYFTGMMVGILPFDVVNNEDKAVVCSVWLQSLSSRELNTSVSPEVGITFVQVGQYTIDFSERTYSMHLWKLPGKDTKVNITESMKLEDLKQPLPPSYEQLASIQGKTGLDLRIYSYPSDDYADFAVLAPFLVENATGIPVEFVLAGGPLPVVKGGTYTWNGISLQYYPVMPLGHFLGLRTDITFRLVSVRLGA